MLRRSWGCEVGEIGPALMGRSQGCGIGTNNHDATRFELSAANHAINASALSAIYSAEAADPVIDIDCFGTTGCYGWHCLPASIHGFDADGEPQGGFGGAPIGGAHLHGRSRLYLNGPAHDEPGPRNGGIPFAIDTFSPLGGIS